MTAQSISCRSAERVVEALRAQGVTTVFDVPGAKFDQDFDAHWDSDINLIVCPHEFMVVAMRRLNGAPGMAIAASGPGVTDRAICLLTATGEDDSLIAICDAVPRSDRLKHTHQSCGCFFFLATQTVTNTPVLTPAGTR